MGTVSSSPGSTTVTPLTFTGQSQFASDFQQILDRAVAIADIPVEQLQNQDQTVLSQEAQLGTLQSSVAGLESALQGLGTLAETQAIGATSSDPDAVTVTATGASTPATYTINSITSLATAASETSLAGFPDTTSTAVSTTGTMNLVVGANQYTLNLTGNNTLNGLVAAINSAGAGVTATVLTTGNGDYLSVSAQNTGATQLSLFDDPSGANIPFLTTNNQGSNAVFEFNGLEVTRTTNSIADLVAGATFTLTNTSDTPVTLTLAPDPSTVSTALQKLVDAYNTVVQQIDSQTGPSAGVLSGDPIVLQVRSTLEQLTQYQGSGAITNLSDLGIDLNQDGTMSFDQTVFDGLTNSDLASAFQFLGSETTGFAGLSENLDGISNTVTGSIEVEEQALERDDSNLQDQISAKNASINAMQNTLYTQLAEADTLISSLNNQQTQLTASIQSLDYVLYGKPTNSN